MKTLLILLALSQFGSDQNYSPFEEVQNEQSNHVWEPRHFRCLVYGFPSCGACRSWERTEEGKVKRGGLQVKHHNVQQSPVQGVALCPTIILQRWDGEKFNEEYRWVGKEDAESILQRMYATINSYNEDRTSSQYNQSSMEKRTTGQITPPSFQRSEPVYSESRSVSDQGEWKTVEETVAKTVMRREKIPGTGWNEGRSACGNPSCSMCYSQYRTVPTTVFEKVKRRVRVNPPEKTEQPSIERAQSDAGRMATPDSVLFEAVASLDLSPRDHLVDLGSGDGRILIHAVSEYGCTAVGVEINEAKVVESRQNIEKAGLSDRIKVMRCDILDFDPDIYGVTAGYVYLYPETISEITEVIDKIPKVVSAFHPIPKGIHKGDFYLKVE